MIKKIKLSHEMEPRFGYSLPFNRPVKIFQGYNGPYSHFAMERESIHHKNIHDHRYSLDFSLPYGSDVLAAKNGTVYGFIENSSNYYDGLDLLIGLDARPNYLIIEHENETFSLYSHLEKKSVTKKFYEPVKKGDVIAKTGKSGWIGLTPHLHFSVFKYPRPGIQTYPIIFDNYDGPLEHSEIYKK
jgi:murein DD-endopeptidase MepM/ murein hydrolase activator NlpD